MTGLGDALALVNALLSVVSAAFAVAGYVAIRRKDVPRHRQRMIVATVASALFLVSFVYRFVRYGFKPFSRHGVLRGIYLAIFFSHEPLAVLNVLLVPVALGLALRGAFAAHREVAQIALPIWLYVLITGVLLYILLYPLAT